MYEYSPAASDNALSDAVSPPSIGAGRPDHSVHFYEDDASLFGNVTDFLSTGLDAGQPVIVIATSAHAEAFADALSARGIDAAAARRREQLVLLDADDMLAGFMVD